MPWQPTLKHCPIPIPRLMKIASFLCACLLFAMSTAHAYQPAPSEGNNSDSITIKSVLDTYQFYQHGKKLGMQKMLRIMAPNEQASRHMRMARNATIIANIFGAAGGTLIGFQLGTYMGGGKPVWAMAGVGAGLVGASIPFSIKAKRNARKAVMLYNEQLSTGAFKNRYELRLIASGNGVGLALGF